MGIEAVSMGVEEIGAGGVTLDEAYDQATKLNTRTRNTELSRYAEDPSLLDQDFSAVSTPGAITSTTYEEVFRPQGEHIPATLQDALSIGAAIRTSMDTGIPISEISAQDHPVEHVVVDFNAGTRMEGIARVGGALVKFTHVVHRSGHPGGNLQPKPRT